MAKFEFETWVVSQLRLIYNGAFPWTRQAIEQTEDRSLINKTGQLNNKSLTRFWNKDAQVNN